MGRRPYGSLVDTNENDRRRPRRDKAKTRDPRCLLIGDRGPVRRSGFAIILVQLGFGKGEEGQEQ